MDSKTKRFQLVIPVHVPDIIWTLWIHRGLDNQLDSHLQDITLLWCFLLINFLARLFSVPSGSISWLRVMTTFLSGENHGCCMIPNTQRNKQTYVDNHHHDNLGATILYLVRRCSQRDLTQGSDQNMPSPTDNMETIQLPKYHIY